MKRAALFVFILIVLSLGALARPQQRSIVPNQNKQVQLSADSMFLRDSVLHCKGNAAARIVPIHADENVVIIHSDEVIYHPDTTEIETRGDAKVTMEKAK